MVYITGDCHAEFTKFSTKNFPEQKEMTKDDIVIVCGDFGGVWYDDKTERYWLKWLNAKPFTTVFVDGNHENFDRLYSDEFPIVDFHGGKAHQIREHIFHLIRGYVFDFEGKKFFAFGGARSHDVQDGVLDMANYANETLFRQDVALHQLLKMAFRVNHVSWWEQEMPSREEMDFGRKTLEDNGNEVDFIITHCCPQEVASFLGYRQPDLLTAYFNGIAHDVKFDKWYFGHYHDTKTTFCKFVMLYERIERVL